MSSERTFEAIVLRRSDSGESDRYLVLLSREVGKIDVIARGARKARSRLSGASEPLVRAKFSVSEGRFRKFVTSVEPITSYPGLRSSYHGLITGLAIAEITSWSSDFEFEGEIVYELLGQALQFLSDDFAPAHVFVWFLANLAVIEGLSPDWTSCQVCNAPLKVSPAAVSPHAHGFLCEDHEMGFNDVIWANASSLIALKKIVELAEPPRTFPDAANAMEVIFRFWQGIIGRPLPASLSAVRELTTSYE